jgi:hypothetical protein
MQSGFLAPVMLLVIQFYGGEKICFRNAWGRGSLDQPHAVCSFFGTGTESLFFSITSEQNIQLCKGGKT